MLFCKTHRLKHWQITLYVEFDNLSETIVLFYEINKWKYWQSTIYEEFNSL